MSGLPRTEAYLNRRHPPAPRRSSVWADITRDPKTGHTVAKDYFKALSFYGGLLYLLVLVPAVVLLTDPHLVLPIEPGVVMILLAFGLVGAKIVDNYLNRKTADDSGQPLAVPTPDAIPPEVMPQVANPNAPIAPQP